MRAIVMTEHGGPEVLETRELPDPVPAEGEVLVRVRAFGLNHADTYMRAGVWSFGIPVLGIECVGVVEQDSSGRLAPGAVVVALVGGLARDRNGSYAELVTVPSTNVVPVRTDLSWADLAAIPEVYATAWVALHGNLAIERGETILVRGATSAVGRAAINLAVDAGATVIATTRTPRHEEQLRGLGAAEVLIDDGRLAAQIHERRPRGIHAVLDLVGNAVLRDSLQCVAPRGRVRQIGFLAATAFRLATCPCRRSSRRRNGVPSRPVRRGCSPSIRSSRPTGSWSPARPAENSSSRFERPRRIRGEQAPVAGINPRGRVAPYTTITRAVIRCLSPRVKRRSPALPAPIFPCQSECSQVHLCCVSRC
jgi:NADPH2:quinone reductase